MYSLTPEQQLEAVRLYLKDDLTAVAVAKHFGVSRQTIYAVFAMHGVVTRADLARPPIPAATRASIAEALKAASASASQVARDFSVSQESVLKIARENQIDLAVGRRRRLTPDQEAAVVKRYLVGDETATAIGLALQVNRQTIQNTLTRCGVATRSRLAKHMLTEAQRVLVVAACHEGCAIQEAADTFDVGLSTVSNILRAYDVSLPIGRRPSCEIDHAAFDTLTPESEFWAGFMFGDGHVHQDRYGAGRIGTALTESDRGHVEKFRAFLKSDHAISQESAGRGAFPGGVTPRANARPTVRFQPRSAQLMAALVRHGMVGVKALREPSMELAVSRDFWRGLVDADGGVGTAQPKRENGRVYPAIMLCGQARLLNHFQQFLVARLGLHLNQSRTKSGIFVVSTTGATALAVIRLLYEGATVALDRKAARAQRLLAGDLTPCDPYK